MRLIVAKRRTFKKGREQTDLVLAAAAVEFFLVVVTIFIVPLFLGAVYIDVAVLVAFHSTPLLKTLYINIGANAKTNLDKVGLIYECITAYLRGKLKQ